MTLLPNTLFAIRHNETAICIGPSAQNLGKQYTLAYYGYTLKIVPIPWLWIVNHSRKIVTSLPARTTLALLH